MNNNINNKKIKVPTGINLNNKDYLTILLTNLKEMEKNMATTMTEASNERLYEHYKNMFENYSELQRKTYELMFKNGWYTLEKAQKTKINNLIKNLVSELKDLN